jgi:hypothetical protein
MEKESTPGRAERQKERHLKKVKAFCDVYATGQYTMTEALKAVGIGSARSFYSWLDLYPEATAMYEQAKEEKETAYTEQIRERCMTSFEKLVSGYEYLEVKNEGRSVEVRNDAGEVVETRFVVTKSSQTRKHVPPNAGAVIFGLVNTMPERFKNQRLLGGGEPGKPGSGQTLPYTGFRFIIGGVEMDDESNE